MWLGLQSLDALDLGRNNLKTIAPGGLANLPNRARLSLYQTGILNLDENVFDPRDFPDSDGHPR